LWKGNYRVRMWVPKAVQSVVGRGEYLTRSLKTPHKVEANRLAAPGVAEFANIISLAERGEWPPLPDEAVELMASEWAQSLIDNVYDMGFNPEDHPPVCRTEEAFDERVLNYLEKNRPDIRRGSAAFDRLRKACFGQSRIRKLRIPHESEVALRRPRIDGATRTRPPRTITFSPGYRFSEYIDAWARERKVQPKTRDEFEAKATKLMQHLGHDDMASVADTDIIGWKDARVASGASHKTIKNDLMAVKTLFNYAERNKKILGNPAKTVRFTAKRGPKRLDYNDEEMKHILPASRAETSPMKVHRLWVPWLTAFTGARIEEVCGAAAADIYKFGGIWVLHTRGENRLPGASLKNEGAERIILLHPTILSEGFINYVEKLPEGGPLFPNLKPDRYGKRGKRQLRGADFSLGRLALRMSAVTMARWWWVVRLRRSCRVPGLWRWRSCRHFCRLPVPVPGQ
jgi:integrase